MLLVVVLMIKASVSPENFCFRHKLNVKKNKVDNFAKKPDPFSSQQVVQHLTSSFSPDDFTETNQLMSRSVIGGSINSYKSRIVQFVRPDRSFNGVLSLLNPAIFYIWP